MKDGFVSDQPCHIKDGSLIRYVLVLDSAMSSGCSAALWDIKRQTGYVQTSCDPRGQAERLVPFAQSVVSEAGIEFSDIDVIATTIGPGSFTGLRVCLSAAQGFALALEKPLLGIPTTQALYMQFKSELGAEIAMEEEAAPPVLVVNETKRQDFYVHAFDGDGEKDRGEPSIEQAKAMSAEAIKDMFFVAQAQTKWVIVGDAYHRLCALSACAKNYTHIDISQIDTKILAQNIAEHMDAFLIRFNTVSPLYLRPADVSISNKKQRVLSGYKDE